MADRTRALARGPVLLDGFAVNYLHPEPVCSILENMTISGKNHLSAGVVIVRQAGDTFQFLMLRAFRHWDFPKGWVEQGETPLQAALREVTEETTLSDLDFAWGKSFLETGPYNRGKLARYYLARTRQEHVELPVNPEIGRPEHSEFRWLSLTEARALASPRVMLVLDWAAQILNISVPE